MTETQKPFVCAKEGCKMTFTNEDHLNVHEKKHDMALHLGIDGQNYVVADQTPTPTRFIRNCEEVGLFQDLQNINPFDETFRKATDLIKTGTLFLPETTVDDTLHTPNVFPHIEETTKPNKFSRNVSNENEFTVTTINNDILKLSDKESPEQNRNKDFESDNDDIEVLSLRSSSSSEQSDENDFIETNSDTLLSNKLDDGVNSNLTATVNNLSDVEIRTNRTLITIVQKDNCKKVESKEDLKSKLKDALHARVRSEHSKSDNENVNFCVLYNIPHSKQMQKKLLQHSKKIIATNEVRTKKLISTQEVTHVEEQIDDNISKKRMTDRDRQREINRVAQVRSRERKKSLDWSNGKRSETFAGRKKKNCGWKIKH